MGLGFSLKILPEIEIKKGGALHLHLAEGLIHKTLVRGLKIGLYKIDLIIFLCLWTTFTKGLPTLVQY